MCKATLLPDPDSPLTRINLMGWISRDRASFFAVDLAGLAGLRLAARDAEMRRALRLDETSRVLLFGTEGATDPDVYCRIVGRAAEEVERGFPSSFQGEGQGERGVGANAEAAESSPSPARLRRVGLSHRKSGVPDLRSGENGSRERPRSGGRDE